jgi:hypothetical protein
VMSLGDGLALDAGINGGRYYGDIGMQSIRKGATIFINSLPGGPPPAAICIRGRWSLGGVKDVYMKYETKGDAFCGRALTLLSIL